MEKKERLLKKLETMAMAKANDAVRLALLGEQALDLLPTMNLSCVSKFKRGTNGVIEVEFIDRLAALRWLADMTEGSNDCAREAFLAALGGDGTPE